MTTKPMITTGNRPTITAVSSTGSSTPTALGFEAVAENGEAVVDEMDA
eukprot:CAMPEP_0176157472 /NCGR_PEP_ID=MMETSP0120_2-20121206/80508_1 /TAXON_ID=160619 /ORGANISM="Kryptoperidinium foliaceum, Strain CCMP 1326" /LENGTH=47 /DNA_ID= /DNA_START= /DNA_END= /DNA_ORIENTATION=